MTPGPGVVGIGVDVVAERRVREALERWPDQYRRRLFTQRERDAWPVDSATFVGGAIALKEASYKSVAAHVARPSWHDVVLVAPVATDDAGAEMQLLTEVVATALGGVCLPFDFVATHVRGLDDSTAITAAWAPSEDGLVAVALAAGR